MVYNKQRISVNSPKKGYVIIMAKFTFTPRGVCSAQIDFEIDDGKVHNIRFTRGCSGNTQGVAKLAEGRDATEIIDLLSGTDCNGRGTSCPDQLAKAISLALDKMKGE